MNVIFQFWQSMCIAHTSFVVTPENKNHLYSNWNLGGHHSLKNGGRISHTWWQEFVSLKIAGPAVTTY